MMISIISTLDSKTSRYVLKALRQEDSRTATYLAEDNILKRPVVFVQLKSSANEKEGRAFLLHARMLGQLQHAGLLPLHDMGLHDECYFYAYRIPPGKSLLEIIIQSKNDSSTFKAKSRHLIYLMSQIADTLSYLHQNYVTIGRLTSESIYIGNFGEVIIKDFSNAQKFDNSQEDEFQKSRKEDLQSLAHLCMRTWLLSPEHGYSIREWDQTAHLAPLDFQEVLDKACLERGGRYANTHDFHKDLLNILQNRPPSFREGDLLFTLKGRYHKNKKACIIFLVLCGIFLITLAANNAPLEDLKKNIDAQKSSLLSLKQELENKEFELKNEDRKYKSLKEISSNLDHRQAKVKEDYTNSKNAEKDLLDKIELQNKTDLAKKEDHKKLMEKEAALRKKQQELTNYLQNSQVSTAIKVENKVDLSSQNLGDFASDHPNPRTILQQLNLIWSENSLDWFNSYLKKNTLADSFSVSYVMAKREIPDNLIVHPNGHIVAWTADRQLFYVNIEEDLALTSVLLSEQLKGLAFNGDRQFSSLNFGRILHWTLSKKGLEKSSLNDYSSKETVFLLSNSKSSENWIGLGKMNTLVGVDPSLPTAKIAKSQDLQRDGDDNIWALIDRKLILLPSGKIMLNCPSDMASWSTHPHGGLSVLHAGRLDIYKLIKGPEDSQLLERVWELDLPLKSQEQNFLSAIVDQGQNRVWVSLSQDQNYLFDRTQRSPKRLNGLVGRVLTVHNEVLITKDDMNLYCYRLSNTKDSLSQIVAENQMTCTRNIKDDWLKKLNINLLWEMAGSNYLIAVREHYFVEIFNKIDQTRTARLAVSPTPLTHVFYSAKLNKIVGSDAEGQIYTW